MNIKNHKTIVIYSNLPENTNTFSFYISIPFNAQYMKIKHISWNLYAILDPNDIYLAINNQIYNIKSSLTNYDILYSLTPRGVSEESDADPPTEIKITQSFSEYASILYKLHNQIINGNYSFEISKPISPYINYEMNIAIQLEFIEYN